MGILLSQMIFLKWASGKQIKHIITLNHSLEWNKDFWSCWFTPCDDSCICGWLDSGASQSNLHDLSFRSASRWHLNTSVDSAETLFSLGLFQRFTIWFKKKLHLGPVLAWSLRILFWVSSCYVGGVNLQELIFLIGREDFMCLDHIPTFLPVD